MVKLLSDCKGGTEPQGIAVDYCYLFRRQCLSIKYIAIKKVYLVTHCHYETKSSHYSKHFWYSGGYAVDRREALLKWPLVKNETIGKGRCTNKT